MTQAAKKFLDESHALFPHEASELGLTQFDAELGRNDPPTHDDYTRLLRETLAAVEALSDEEIEGLLGADAAYDGTPESQDSVART